MCNEGTLFIRKAAREHLDSVFAHRDIPAVVRHGLLHLYITEYKNADMIVCNSCGNHPTEIASGIGHYASKAYSERIYSCQCGTQYTVWVGENHVIAYPTPDRLHNIVPLACNPQVYHFSFIAEQLLYYIHNWTGFTMMLKTYWKTVRYRTPLSAEVVLKPYYGLFVAEQFMTMIRMFSNAEKVMFTMAAVYPQYATEMSNLIKQGGQYLATLKKNGIALPEHFNNILMEI